MSTYAILISLLHFILLAGSRRLFPGSTSAPNDHVNGRDLAGFTTEKFCDRAPTLWYFPALFLPLLFLGVGCLSQGKEGAKEKNMKEIEKPSCTGTWALTPSRHSRIPLSYLQLPVEVRNLTSTDRFCNNI